MSPWPAGIPYLTLFVEDLDAAKKFYTDVFGLSVVWEDDASAVFDFGNTKVNLLKDSEAHELIAPMVVAPAGMGARAQFTISVEDVDALSAEIVRHGATLINGPLDRPWGIRTVCFADPGGHVWELAQDL